MIFLTKICERENESAWSNEKSSRYIILKCDCFKLLKAFIQYIDAKPVAFFVNFLLTCYLTIKYKFKDLHDEIQRKTKVVYHRIIGKRSFLYKLGCNILINMIKILSEKHRYGEIKNFSALPYAKSKWLRRKQYSASPYVGLFRQPQRKREFSLSCVMLKEQPQQALALVMPNMEILRCPDEKCLFLRSKIEKKGSFSALNLTKEEEIHFLRKNECINIRIKNISNRRG